MSEFAVQRGRTRTWSWVSPQRRPVTFTQQLKREYLDAPHTPSREAYFPGFRTLRVITYILYLFSVRKPLVFSFWHKVIRFNTRGNYQPLENNGSIRKTTVSVRRRMGLWSGSSYLQPSKLSGFWGWGSVSSTNLKKTKRRTEGHSAVLRCKQWGKVSWRRLQDSGLRSRRVLIHFPRHQPPPSPAALAWRSTDRDDKFRFHRQC